jgi:hypothetical protein
VAARIPPPRLAADRIAVRLAELDDARVARLLATVVLPAMGPAGPARDVVRSAIARLARADLGSLTSRELDLHPVAALPSPSADAPLRVRILQRRPARSR